METSKKHGTETTHHGREGGAVPVRRLVHDGLKLGHRWHEARKEWIRRTDGKTGARGPRRDGTTAVW